MTALDHLCSFALLTISVSCAPAGPDVAADGEGAPSADADGTNGIEPPPPDIGVDVPSAKATCHDVLIDESIPWRFVHFLDVAGTPLVATEGRVGFACSASSGAGPCNTPWSAAQPWQWAAAQRSFDCKGFDGRIIALMFEARSRSGNARLAVQLSTPDERPLTGETYKSSELVLGSDWQHHYVDFFDVRQPDWSSVEAPLDLQALTGMAFLVREVEPQVSPDGEPGEKLLPFGIERRDLQLDQVTR